MKKIAHWADEFSTDAFGEMLAIFVRVDCQKKKNQILNLKKCSPLDSYRIS